ncbi:MAG TPA: helix-turn-helix domain-containing protein, partial [Bacilli bacterium]
QAMAMNVLDYLVKVPLRESDLAAVLEKAGAALLRDEEKDLKFHHLQVTVQGNIQRLRKQVMEELLYGGMNSRVLKQRSKELMIDFQFKDYSSFVVRLDGYGQFQNDYGSGDQKTLKYGMLNIIEELIRNASGAFACEIGSDRFVGFISWPNLNSAIQIENKAYEIGQSIYANIKKYLDLSISIGYSKPLHGWDSIATAYEEAANALMDSFYLGYGSIITPLRKLGYEEAAAAEVEAHLKEMLEYLSPADEQGLQGLRKLKDLVNKKKVSPVNLIAMIKQFFVQIDRKASAWKGLQTTIPLDTISHVTHCEQLMKIIGEKWNESRLQMSHSNERLEIIRAKQYIESYLTDRLALHQVAEHVNMNPSYFSELFKKEVKEGFTDYVNRKRIERAIQMLQTNHYSNAELAEAVGIMNEAYFCTVFKKITGKSPQKYSAR